MNTNHRIAISGIVSPLGRRDLHDDRVADIAQSMQKLGLLNPIGVRMVEGMHALAYGRHRHAVAERLGWTEIECQILDIDDDRHVRRAEIAENLHRAELSALERCTEARDGTVIPLSRRARTTATLPAEAARRSSGAGFRMPSQYGRQRPALRIMRSAALGSKLRRLPPCPLDCAQ
jgi:hypothetical protein